MSDSRIKDLTYENSLTGGNILPIDRSSYTDAKKTTIDDVKDYTLNSSSNTLNRLSDVDAPSPSSNDLIHYNGTNWVTIQPDGLGLLMDDLVNVDAPSPNDGDILQFDSGVWETGPAPSGGGTSSDLSWKIGPVNSTPSSGYFSLNNTATDSVSSMKINVSPNEYPSHSIGDYFISGLGVGSYFKVFSPTGEFVLFKITSIADNSSYLTIGLSNVDGSYTWNTNDVEYTFNFNSSVSSNGGGGLGPGLGLSSDGTNMNVGTSDTIGANSTSIYIRQQSIDETHIKTLSTPTTSTTLGYNGTELTWKENSNLGILMDDLDNVDASSPNNGDILQYDSGVWETGHPPSGTFIVSADIGNDRSVTDGSNIDFDGNSGIETKVFVGPGGGDDSIIRIEIADEGVEDIKLYGISTGGSSGQILESDGSGGFGWTTNSGGVVMRKTSLTGDGSTQNFDFTSPTGSSYPGQPIVNMYNNTTGASEIITVYQNTPTFNQFRLHFKGAPANGDVYSVLYFN